MKTEASNLPQIFKDWNLANLIVLVGSLLLPWIVFSSGLGSFEVNDQYELGINFLFYPFLALSQLFQSAFEAREFALGLGLSVVLAAAPAMSIYYLFHGLRRFFKLEEANKPINSIFRLIVASLSLIAFGTRFNISLSGGYILGAIGLISTFVLDLALMRYKSIEKEES